MEDFADLLEEIKSTGGELMWISQKKEFLESLNNTFKRRDPLEIKQAVLNSQRLRHCIDQILERQNNHQAVKQSLEPIKRDDIIKEANQIIDEMAHQFNFKYVRVLGIF
jgi:hypothetical protein